MMSPTTSSTASSSVTIVGGATVLIDDDAEVGPALLRAAHELRNGHGLGHEQRRPQKRADRPVRFTFGEGGQEVFHHNDAADVVHVILEHRHAQYSCSR